MMFVFDSRELILPLLLCVLLWRRVTGLGRCVVADQAPRWAHLQCQFGILVMSLADSVV